MRKETNVILSLEDYDTLVDRVKSLEFIVESDVRKKKFTIVKRTDDFYFSNNDYSKISSYDINRGFTVYSDDELIIDLTNTNIRLESELKFTKASFEEQRMKSLKLEEDVKMIKKSLKWKLLTRLCGIDMTNRNL